jgi:hypothetical protein
LGAFAGIGALTGCSGESDKAGDDQGERGGSSGESSGGSSGTGGAGSGGTSGAGQGGSSGTEQGGAGQGGSSGTEQGGAGQGGSSGTEEGGSGGACTGNGEGATLRRHGQRGRSSGFSGTDAQYAEIYDVPCASVDDCLGPCAARGGTEEMCGASTCVDSTSDYCLPATVWRNTTALRSEGTESTDGAELVLVWDPYEDFLLVDDFKLEVPETAEITGITVTIRRAGGTSMEAVDGAIRLIKGGTVGASDRASPMPWTGPEYTNVDYGGQDDLWGQTWTPADVNSQDFGVALSAIYADMTGNGRAYVDIVYATIHYVTSCE